ncbi:MAG TPA: universal stress protein [Actinomycetes bacterium]|nr:universal stress protein [Actinomycetes bacterium]
MHRYLVVANQTLGGEQLTAKLAEYGGAGPCRFYLVVPVTNTEASDRWFTGGLEGALPGAYKIARTLAGGRLQHELDRLREAGTEVDGEVVDPNPLDAIRKIASREEVDEVVVSTLPRRLSRWLAMDLPHRIRRATSLPVTHITGGAGPSL